MFWDKEFMVLEKIIIKPILDKWVDFFNISMITCKEWKETMEEYKDNEKAFIYLDPPYSNSFNNIIINIIFHLMKIILLLTIQKFI
jgi:site-specific DNA-adenine methylase